MRALPFLLLLLLFSLSAEAAPPADADRTGGNDSLWRSEYQLAKTPRIYLVFDLHQKKISVKVRGVVLKEMPIDSWSVFGAPVQPRPLPLLSKDAIGKPKRIEVKPAQKEDEENPSALQALQVEDMPARYRLNFEEGLRIYVRPKSEGVRLTLFNLVSSLKSYFVTRPFGLLWNELHGENFTEMVLHLDEKDAKSLYWAFQDGFFCIIWGR